MKVFLIFFVVLFQLSAYGQKVVAKALIVQGDKVVYGLWLETSGHKVAALELNVSAEGGKITEICLSQASEQANKTLVFSQETGKFLLFGFGGKVLNSGILAYVVVRGINISSLRLKDGMAAGDKGEKLLLSEISYQ